MIDWLIIRVPFRHRPIRNGAIVSVDENGIEEWSAPKKRTVTGSFETGVRVRSGGYLDADGNCQHIDIDGNPSKFLQGHNVLGSDDPLLLVTLWFKAVCLELDLPFTIFDLYRISRGDFTVSRVDVNYLFDVGSCANARAFLDAAGRCGSTKYKVAVRDKGGVYFNKGSRRWSSVWYYKHNEIQINRGKRYQLKMSALNQARMISFTKGKLRLEFKIQSLDLKDLGIVTGSDLANYGAFELWKLYYSKIKLVGNMRIQDEKINQLPNELKSTYLLWLEGHDIRNTVSRATFYRHKKQLLAFGVNLDEPVNEGREMGSNVVPLVRVIEAAPVSIPSWMYEDDLVVWSRAV